jgi:hypothetical protein
MGEIVGTTEDGHGDGGKGVMGWWPWRRRRGAGRGRPHLRRARGHGGLMMEYRIGNGGRKKMTWDPHASEWRGERGSRIILEHTEYEGLR